MTDNRPSPGLVDNLCDRILRALARALVALAEWLGFDLAITEEPPDSVVVICPCGQKNRIRRVDFGRGPICGKCQRRLVLPS